MKEKNLNYMMYAYPNGELGTAEFRDFMMNSASLGTSITKNSAEKEIEELHKLFDPIIINHIVLIKIRTALTASSVTTP